jgi:hypothetical protein
VLSFSTDGGEVEMIRVSTPRVDEICCDELRRSVGHVTLFYKQSHLSQHVTPTSCDASFQPLGDRCHVHRVG